MENCRKDPNSISVISFNYIKDIFALKYRLIIILPRRIMAQNIVTNALKEIFGMIVGDIHA